MAKSFRLPVSQDFEIMDGDEVYGTLRVKPSGVLWAPKGSHDWYRLSIEELAEYAVSKGKKQKK